MLEVLLTTNTPVRLVRRFIQERVTDGFAKNIPTDNIFGKRFGKLLAMYK